MCLNDLHPTACMCKVTKFYITADLFLMKPILGCSLVEWFQLCQHLWGALFLLITTGTLSIAAFVGLSRNSFISPVFCWDAAGRRRQSDYGTWTGNKQNPWLLTDSSAGQSTDFFGRKLNSKYSLVSHYKIQGVFLICWICFLNNSCLIASFAAKFRTLRLEGCHFVWMLFDCYGLFLWLMTRIQILKFEKFRGKVRKFKIVRIISKKCQTILNRPFWETFVKPLCPFSASWAIRGMSCI